MADVQSQEEYCYFEPIVNIQLQSNVWFYRFSELSQLDEFECMKPLNTYEELDEPSM
jgi:hypothetical protein